MSPCGTSRRRTGRAPRPVPVCPDLRDRAEHNEAPEPPVEKSLLVIRRKRSRSGADRIERMGSSFLGRIIRGKKATAPLIP